MLPTELNQILIIVVVLSMALTPTLAEAGKRLAIEADRRWPEPAAAAAAAGAPEAAEAKLVRCWGCLDRLNI